MFSNTSLGKIDFYNMLDFRMKGTSKNTVSKNRLSGNPSLPSDKNSLKSNLQDNLQ